MKTTTPTNGTTGNTPTSAIAHERSIAAADACDRLRKTAHRIRARVSSLNKKLDQMIDDGRMYEDDNVKVHFDNTLALRNSMVRQNEAIRSGIFALKSLAASQMNLSNRLYQIEKGVSA